MKEKKKNIIVITTLIIIQIIGVFGFIFLLNNNTYNKAKVLIEDGEYYEAFNMHYDNLDSFHKNKLEKLIIDEISNKIWKTQRTSKYGFEDNCIGNEYVEINNKIISHYVICGKHQFEFSNKNEINLTLKEVSSSKIIFEMTKSDNLSLFIYSNNDINIQGSAVASAGNYTELSCYKFIVIE